MKLGMSSFPIYLPEYFYKENLPHQLLGYPDKHPGLMLGLFP